MPDTSSMANSRPAPRRPRAPLLTIIRAELTQRRWFTLWWIIGVIAFITLNLAVYPAVRDQTAQLDQVMQQIPPAARSMLSDTSSLLSPIGYLSSKIYYLMLPLLLTFLAISLGSSLIAREERQRTIELLLARPISRGTLLLGKAAAGVIIIIKVSVVVALLTTLEVTIIGFKGVRAQDILLTTLMSAVLALLFGAVAFTFTAAGRFGRAASIAVSTLLALGGYIISSLGTTVEWLRWPAKFLPFHYYHPAKILGGTFTWREALAMFGVSAALLVIAWLIFRRRDIS